jgi:hypothetical protein
MPNIPFETIPFGKIEFWKWRRCKVRILIVADGGIDFSTSPFGLDELISKSLNSSSMPYVDFEITKAHRGSMATGASILNFKFDNTQSPPPAQDKSFSINNYDQVWLFGVERTVPVPQPPPPALPVPPLPTIDASQLRALADFMNAGGGVFATGDHENLGQAICAEIPRVRSMRKWYWPSAPTGRLIAPDGSTANRLDTTVVGNTPGNQFADQSDETPQNIIPKYFNFGTGSIAHPLLSKFGGGVIKFLPDHAHEGECVIPTATALNEKISSVDPRDEYPMIDGGAERVSPQIVAISYSGAGQLSDLEKPAVNPRCFGAIAAYDGHIATGNIGRVCVDSTWHHFLNINLNGTGSMRTTDRGFYVGGNPTPEYLDIKQYFRNIALWISPKTLQRCFRFKYIYFIRYSFPLIWEVRPLENPTWKQILDVGIQTRKMIEQTFSSAEVIEAAKIFLEFEGKKSPTILMRLLTPHAQSKEIEKLKSPLLSEDLIVNLVLGGVTQQIVNKLPEFPQQAEDFFKLKSDSKKLEDNIKSGVKIAIKCISSILDEHSKKSIVMLKEMIE